MSYGSPVALRVEATRGWRVLVYFFRDMKRGDSRETARTTFKNVLFCTRKFDSRLRQQREFALWTPPSPINPASYIHAASSGSTVRPAHSAQQRGATRRRVNTRNVTPGQSVLRWALWSSCCEHRKHGVNPVGSLFSGYPFIQSIVRVSTY